jgi:hypothetical protein
MPSADPKIAPNVALNERLQQGNASDGMGLSDHFAQQQSEAAHVGSGSKAEKLRMSKCCPLCSRKRTFAEARAETAAWIAMHWRVLDQSTAGFDPGCVKTHTSAKTQGGHSLTRLWAIEPG